MKFITIHTHSPYPGGSARNVSLAKRTKGPDAGKITLLGNLEHGTEITINQKLVNALQAWVDEEQNIPTFDYNDLETL